MGECASEHTKFTQSFALTLRKTAGSVLQCVAAFCSALQRATVCCACCSVSLSLAVCGSALQCTAEPLSAKAPGNQRLICAENNLQDLCKYVVASVSRID